VVTPANSAEAVVKTASRQLTQCPPTLRSIRIRQELNHQLTTMSSVNKMTAHQEKRSRSLNWPNPPSAKGTARLKPILAASSQSQDFFKRKGLASGAVALSGWWPRLPEAVEELRQVFLFIAGWYHREQHQKPHTLSPVVSYRDKNRRHGWEGRNPWRPKGAGISRPPGKLPRLCGRLGPIVKKWFWGALSPSLTPESFLFLKPNGFVESMIA